jgi:hypothetical protein
MITIPFNWTNAHNATEWCVSNFKDDDWKMELVQMGPVKYVFKFQKEQDATLFSLRWLEHS